MILGGQEVIMASHRYNMVIEDARLVQKLIPTNFFYIFSSPTPDQRRDVCRAIITTFPFLADVGGGYVSYICISNLSLMSQLSMYSVNLF
jgi:hypothetical protein